ATAYTLTQQYPDKRITVLEKEAGLAQHQTGHNSGVLHSGVYYKPGSLKAVNSLAGRRAMLEFCDREGIPYKLCGKVIVAVGEGDEARLDMLHERGVANGIAVEVIGRDRLDELEPHAAGKRALYLPNAGIVDFRLVCDRLADRVRERGHSIQTGAEVTGLTERDDSVAVRSTAGDFAATYVVNCAGLHSDRVAALGGTPPAARIVPFRGEYYRLKPEAEHLCNALIYPVPDPQFPFLGVHFTRTAWGEVECGPNAVLAFAREGYRKTDVNVGDLWGTLTYPGFIKLGAHYWRMGAGEMWRSLSKAAFVKALQRLMPEITAEQLEPMPAGIRAQAVAADGRMLDDFAFAESARMVHVVNAPSPAATASLSIGKTIVEKLAQRF
ncbi:MAG: L-2-hydroxyglutarate oxidase, partial [Anaerolineae bacterium]|nr:L-2-hydroxyglutarate oxidase [Anaerolineae bacterium]